MQNKNLGVETENIVFFNQSNMIYEHQAAFKEQIKKIAGVLAASYVGHLPTEVNSDTSDPTWRGKDPSAIYSIKNMFVDADFAETFKAEILAGRDYSEDFSNETKNMLINETFAKLMGLDNPVGEIIDFWGERRKVIGVVKDFNQNSLHNPIHYTMILYDPQNTWRMCVRVEAKNAQQTVKEIEKTFREFDPSVPFEYSFLDEELQKKL